LKKHRKGGLGSDGKLKADRYFMGNVLPEIDVTAKYIKSEDLSVMGTGVESLAA
jgi:hypothetical protein